MTTYEKIKLLCEKDGFSISSMPQKIPGLSISKASITGWKNGSVPRPEKLKAIADYFNVTPESLLGDETVSVQTVQDNHCIIGNTNAPVTIMNGNSHSTEQETELINIFRSLGVMEQAKLLVYASDLKAGTKS